MPIVTIKIVEGLLTKEKKRTLHRRITDPLAEIEGNSKPAENYSMGGIQASTELFGLSE